MKLTIDQLEALVVGETYFQHGTLTICVAELSNGATVTGTSNVLDPANYDAELGRIYARKQAVEKLWELEGYALKTRGR